MALPCFFIHFSVGVVPLKTLCHWCVNDEPPFLRLVLRLFRPPSKVVANPAAARLEPVYVSPSRNALTDLALSRPAKLNPPLFFLDLFLVLARRDLAIIYYGTKNDIRDSGAPDLEA